MFSLLPAWPAKVWRRHPLCVTPKRPWIPARQLRDRHRAFIIRPAAPGGAQMPGQLDHAAGCTRSVPSSKPPVACAGWLLGGGCLSTMWMLLRCGGAPRP